MTEVMTSDAVAQETDGLDAVDEQLMRQLTERARAEGLQLTGEGGLLARLTKAVSRVFCTVIAARYTLTASARRTPPAAVGSIRTRPIYRTSTCYRR
ncbi:hypothetical protein GFS60_06775 (plasmid) [Rhodococcus sp. WAY2]|nr:hypothetical protein GFS60_06775 [Rhodococcus sp. WAY2]